MADIIEVKQDIVFGKACILSRLLPRQPSLCMSKQDVLPLLQV